MSLELIRSVIHKRVSDLILTYTPTYPLKVEFDNREVINTKAHSDPYLQVKLGFLGGEQGELSDRPFHRFEGQLQLFACVPKNSGSAEAYKLLEHFYKGCHRSRLGPVLLFMSSTLATTSADGWVKYGVAIPFVADVPG
jgi:hypothetical protein